MSTTYDVRIWKTEKRVNKVRTSYRVLWRVGGRHRFNRTFTTQSHAESFRSKLLVAANEGVAFDIETGLPTTMLRTTETMSWYEFACAYADMKWPDASPKHRRSIAQSLVPITVGMTTTDRGMPDRKTLNKALMCAFNPSTRHDEHPEDIAKALRWVAKHSQSVSELAESDVFREVIAEINTKLDGARAASNTIRLRRTTLSNAIAYAQEKKLLTSNPMDEIKVKRNKTTLREVDRRSVANPVQARTLLRAVHEERPRLYAFFALLYFGALRPEEASNIRHGDLALPEQGWGEIHLTKAAPEVGKDWTDSRTRTEQRGLKHRDDDAGRTVPCCPELTTILRDHLNRYGTTADGRLFRAHRSQGLISSSVYGRVWAKAREATFTPAFRDSPLAKRPYDLRHAAVSTWLNGGVEPTRVADWAGHSVGVLLRVYAKCLDGGEAVARQRVETALGGA